MKNTFFIGLYVLLIFCIGCKQKKINIRTEPVIPVVQIQLPDYLKFTRHEIVDHEITGMVAFECLIPENWTSRDQVIWDSTDSSYPIRFKGSFYDSTSKMKIQVYPDVRSSYCIGPRGIRGKKPPLSALDGLKEIIKKNRADKSYQIINEKAFEAPESKSENKSLNATSDVENSMVRIEYEENNEKIAEEFYGKLDVRELGSQSFVKMNTTLWVLDDLYSCKSSKGRLDACRNIALTIKASKKQTLEFYNKLIQLHAILKEDGFQKLFQEVQRNTIINQTTDDVSQSISDDYYKMQQIQIKNNTLFYKYLGEFDLYKFENHYSVLLPPSYKSAWKNESGDYILSRIVGFDPNANSSNKWTMLERF